MFDPSWITAYDLKVPDTGLYEPDDSWQGVLCAAQAVAQALIWACERCLEDLHFSDLQLKGRFSKSSVSVTF